MTINRVDIKQICLGVCCFPLLALLSIVNPSTLHEKRIIGHNVKESCTFSFFHFLTWTQLTDAHNKGLIIVF